MIFDAQGKHLLAPIMLTDDQTAGLKPYFGDIDTEDYPVVNVRLFAEEQADE